MNEEAKPRVSTLTLIAFNINCVIENGYGSQVSFMNYIHGWRKGLC